jgi:hypothetical protein
LTGIPAAPRGVPQIEVSFELDANGILKVTAGDKGTGKTESITITNDKGRLTQEEIERMVQEAEQYADEDKAAKERIEARNGLENYAFSLKNQVNDEEGLGGKIDEDDKETVSNFATFLLPVLIGNSSSKPSRKPRNGSMKTPLPPLPKISRSRRRSFPTLRTPSPASYIVEELLVETTMSLGPMTSCRLEEINRVRHIGGSHHFIATFLLGVLRCISRV